MEVRGEQRGSRRGDGRAEGASVFVRPLPSPAASLWHPFPAPPDLRVILFRHRFAPPALPLSEGVWPSQRSQRSQSVCGLTPSRGQLPTKDALPSRSSSREAHNSPPSAPKIRTALSRPVQSDGQSFSTGSRYQSPSVLSHISRLLLPPDSTSTVSM